MNAKIKYFSNLSDALDFSTLQELCGFETDVRPDLNGCGWYVKTY